MRYQEQGGFWGLVGWCLAHWPALAGGVAGLYLSSYVHDELFRYSDSPFYGGPWALSFLPFVACLGAGIWFDWLARARRDVTRVPAHAPAHAHAPAQQGQVDPSFWAAGQKQETWEDVWREIEGLVGLEPVKQKLKEVVALVIASRQRVQQGLPPLYQSLHMAFLGNPGTGKTTVARLVGRLFKALGVLPSGHLVETDRSGLVAQYVGQTAPKTWQVVNQALGGVLFVDEAYSLARGQAGHDFGAEALDVLVKAMEDYRHSLCVILAGYTDETRKLFELNPGLKSRIAFVIEFPDYSPEELVEIAKKYAASRGWSLGEGAEEELLARFQQVRAAVGQLGNGRYARKVVEEAERRAAVRIARGEGPADVLLSEDFRGGR
ncbi:AAA family ATPase [Desulfothermobacter acidiphilus]|uniref:AAA family ATPase n=1 Tax=Desulfothermobacter acidiphilus TaxID=1938353 RepID=UPI003F8B0F38